MYHEEQIINGILHWRSTTKDEWHPYSAVELTSKLKQWQSAAEEWDCGSPDQLRDRIHQLPEAY